MGMLSVSNKFLWLGGLVGMKGLAGRVCKEKGKGYSE